MAELSAEVTKANVSPDTAEFFKLKLGCSVHPFVEGVLTADVPKVKLFVELAYECGYRDGLVCAKNELERCYKN